MDRKCGCKGVKKIDVTLYSSITVIMMKIIVRLVKVFRLILMILWLVTDLIQLFAKMKERLSLSALIPRFM